MNTRKSSMKESPKKSAGLSSVLAAFFISAIFMKVCATCFPKFRPWHYLVRKLARKMAIHPS